MGEYKIYESKREKWLLSINIELDFYKTQKKAAQGPENQSPIIFSIN